MTTIFKYEPISFLIAQGKDEEVLNFLPLLYKTPNSSNDQERKQIFEQFIVVEKSKVLVGQNEITFR
jgi:hypothetical protein